MFVLTCHFSHVIIICYEVALYADRHLLSLMNRAAVIAYQDEILNHGKLKLKLNFTAYVIQANFKTLYHNMALLLNIRQPTWIKQAHMMTSLDLKSYLNRNGSFKDDMKWKSR